MKAVVFLSLFLGAYAHAEDATCAISQIVTHVPQFAENKRIDKNAPNELKTTDGLFTGKVVYQSSYGAYSITLKYKDITVGGFFDGSPKDSLLSIHADGKHAQINCFF